MAFEQKLILALASNPEFIKGAVETYNNEKTVWYAVSEQVNSCVNAIKYKESNQ